MPIVHKNTAPSTVKILTHPIFPDIFLFVFSKQLNTVTKPLKTLPPIQNPSSTSQHLHFYFNNWHHTPQLTKITLPKIACLQNPLPILFRNQSNHIHSKATKNFLFIHKSTHKSSEVPNFTNKTTKPPLHDPSPKLPHQPKILTTHLSKSHINLNPQFPIQIPTKSHTQTHTCQSFNLSNLLAFKQIQTHTERYIKYGSKNMTWRWCQQVSGDRILGFPVMGFCSIMAPRKLCMGRTGPRVL
jgi:hypothetical protein